jgi:hypothetical protein
MRPIQGRQNRARVESHMFRPMMGARAVIMRQVESGRKKSQPRSGRRLGELLRST